VPNLLNRQQRNPVRQVFSPVHNRYHPNPSEMGSALFPYAITRCRLTEHHTAGGMSRWMPYLSDLQSEMFCEVSPELTTERELEHGGWATIVTARAAIEARVLVTGPIPPLVINGRIIHQIGLPYHWGPNGYSAGDAANEVSSIALDPNVHIHEVKAISGDIGPGRRPRGPARAGLVEEYIRRAGISGSTGMEVRGGE
jgi:formate dehydrogenase major subunit